MPKTLYEVNLQMLLIACIVMLLATQYQWSGIVIIAAWIVIIFGAGMLLIYQLARFGRYMHRDDKE